MIMLKTSCIIVLRPGNCKTKKQEDNQMNERNQSNDLHSLSHTKWNCKYHVVFAPKYRRAVFYDSKRVEIGKILRELCEWKGVNIVEAEVCKDHVHMLLEIPPKISISGFMGFLKGKSSQMIYERWGDTNIEEEISGVEDIMWTQQERTRKENKNISRIN